MRVRRVKASAAVAFGLAAILPILLNGREARAEPADAASVSPARPPLPPVPPGAPLPWERHLGFGPDVAFVALPAHVDGGGKATAARFWPAFGFGLHLNIELLRYLGFSAYLVDSRHGMSLPDGVLGQPGSIEDGVAHALHFGVHFSPTLPLTERARLWAMVGAGWGRLEFSRMHVVEPGQDPFMIRERADAVVELPLGIGASFEVVPRWLSVQVELSYAFDLAQYGTGREGAQAIDAAGKKRSIGPLPRLDGLLVQTVGVSLLL